MNMPIDFKNYDIKPVEKSQNLNIYNEEIIIKEINANFRIDEIMEPIYSNLMADKKEYNQIKYENDKKEMRLGVLEKHLIEIELKEDFGNLRNKIIELKEQLKIEKESLWRADCQTKTLLQMENMRKHDLTIKKQPVIKELMLAPNIAKKTEKEIEDLNSKITVLNQIYVILKEFSILLKLQCLVFFCLVQFKRSGQGF